MSLRNLFLASVVFFALALALSFYLGERNSALNAASVSKLKGLAWAMAVYDEKYGHFPPAFKSTEKGKLRHSWRVLLLEFLDKDLYDAYRFDQAWDSEKNREIANAGAHFFTARRDSLISDYYVIVGDDTLFPKDGNVLRGDLRKRTSASTILIVESVTPKANWMAPIDLSIENMSFVINDQRKPSISSNFTSSPNIVCVDWSVIPVATEIGEDALRKRLLLQKK
jgi:Protein of unknown function (DUF1559)